MFKFFRKLAPHKSHSTNNGVMGPTFLEDITENIENPYNLRPNEWRRRLKTPDGQIKYRVKFYGKNKGIIRQTDFAPQVIFAVNSTTGEEHLLFDGCKHGYNAHFCDLFTNDQINNRHSIDIYKDTEGNELFDIIISTFYGINYDEELENQIDDNTMVEIIGGSKMKVDTVKRNGFDSIQIWVISDTGKRTEILSEECS